MYYLSFIDKFRFLQDLGFFFFLLGFIINLCLFFFCSLVRVFVKYLESDSAPGLGDLNEVEKQIQRHLDVISVINNSMSQLVFNVGSWEQRVRSGNLPGLSAKIDDYKARVQHLLDLSEAADAQEAANAQ